MTSIIDNGWSLCRRIIFGAGMRLPQSVISGTTYFTFSGANAELHCHVICCTFSPCSMYHRVADTSSTERSLMPSLLALQLLAEIRVRDCCGATSVCNLSEALWTCGSSVCCRHLGVVSFQGGNTMFPIVKYAVCKFSQPLRPSHSQIHCFSAYLCSLFSYALC